MNAICQKIPHLSLDLQVPRRHNLISRPEIARTVASLILLVDDLPSIRQLLLIKQLLLLM